MDRTFESSADAAPPNPPASPSTGYARAGNPQTATPATKPGPWWYHMVTEEIRNVIASAGLTPDHTAVNQLTLAIQAMIVGAQKAVIVNGVTFEASVSNGEVVRWDSGNSRFDEAVADGTSNNRAVGVADVTNSKVYLYGECPLFSGLTPGARYYLDATTPGAITTTAPTDAVSVGIAKSATTLWVDVDVAPQAVGNKQIQPISASVGSNALTISASALSLEFRSTTLGSGAVTTVSGTPANLVISSGSTLGTVSGQISRIAVLAINNAGTIELAAVNIAGGNNLDETTLISTTAEGGAGGADSANVIYSATARSNAAFRVIGYVESTQAAAGTWATAPSTVQGAGGNAMTALQSIGFGQTWQNVTGSRASGTTYYNTTGKPILVNVTVSSSGLTYGTAQATVSGVALNVHQVGGASGTTMIYGPTFIVPPGASYSVSIASGSLHTWTELR